MNINTSNYWSSSAASSNGMSGLVSGLDTESMVEQLLSGTQSKIDAQKALKQQTEWKQEIYRDIITSINSFQSKYFNTSFDASATMNFASSAFFNSMKAALNSGSGLKVVSADSTALTGEMRVKIDRLASAARLESQDGHRVSSDQITGKQLDADTLRASFEKTLTLTFGSGDSAREVTVDLMGASTEDEIAQTINSTLSANGISDVTASVNDGKLQLQVASGSANTLTGIKASSLAGEMTGFGDGKNTSTDANGNTVISAAVQMDPDATLTFNMILDGVQKEIRMDNVTDLTAEGIAKAVTQKLDKAFGTGVLQATVVDGAIQFGYGASLAGEKGHEFRMTGVDLNALGVVPGSASHVNTSTKLGDIQGISGGLFEFEINGETFSFDENNTIGDVIEAVNESDAGVKLSYSTLADNFVLESASTGGNYSITVQQSTGNLLTRMFGDVVDAGTSLSTERMTKGTIQGQAVTDNVREASIKFTVNGTSYSFDITRDEDNPDKVYTPEEFADQFNEYLKTNFNGAVTYDGASGQLNIERGYEVSVTSVTVAGEKGEIDLGLQGKTNLADENTTLAELNNLTSAEKAALGGDSTTLGSLSGDVAFQDGRLTVSSEAGLSKLSDMLAGASLGTGAQAQGAAGQDALVTINGVQTSRSSNTFTVDGITMELTAVNDEEAVIGTTRDVDSIVEGFKSFVNDYNEMLDKLNGYVDADAEYRDYDPLTDAQKKEMSDREIELWEEKAKTGLIHADSSVESFLMQMRIAMYTKPAGSKLALYDIGIETGDYKQKGKLQLDETALRNALASDPSSVEKLFTDATEGLASQLTTIMKNTANQSSGSPGVLVQLAGASGYATEDNNTLSKQLSEIEERIQNLEDQYDREKERYWNQFNTMEQILANFNSQSAMLQSQFSSY